MRMAEQTDWDEDGKPRKPAVVGIGAQKAGTTWLSQILSQHPRIWTPPFKEVQFFNARYVPEHMKWLPWHFRRGKVNIQKRFDARGEEMPAHLQRYLARVTREPMFTNHWYKMMFAPAPAGTLPMDITPEYSTLPPEGVDFVSQFLGNTKFIYILRHPVDRAISQLKMNISRAGRKPATLDDWMTEIEDPVLYDRGDYATYVPRWKQHFGDDQLLILPFGAISRDPLGVMRQVEKFLAIRPHDYRNLGNKVFASTKGLSVPDEARSALRARLAPQFAFLDDAFPKEFTEQIR